MASAHDVTAGTQSAVSALAIGGSRQPLKCERQGCAVATQALERLPIVIRDPDVDMQGEALTPCALAIDAAHGRLALSLDDKTLYASCWGTGRFLQFDVSDPQKPVLKSDIRIGGIVKRAPHPARPGVPLSGGPQMVEFSRDCKRAYFSNSLYSPWDRQFYPEASAAGWSRPTSRPTARSRSTRSSSSTRRARGCGRTRSTSRAHARLPGRDAGLRDRRLPLGGAWRSSARRGSTSTGSGRWRS